MKTLTPVLLFLLSNIIGYMLVVILYAVAPIYGFINIETTDFLLNKEIDMGIVLVMWLICAIFSFASFFLSRKWKIFFLSAPIIVPLICSLKLLAAYA